jgi:hypothetical protein
MSNSLLAINSAARFAFSLFLKYSSILAITNAAVLLFF